MLSEETTVAVRRKRDQGETRVKEELIESGGKLETESKFVSG